MGVGGISPFFRKPEQVCVAVWVTQLISLNTAALPGLSKPLRAGVDGSAVCVSFAKWIELRFRGLSPLCVPVLSLLIFPRQFRSSALAKTAFAVEPHCFARILDTHSPSVHSSRRLTPSAADPDSTPL